MALPGSRLPSNEPGFVCVRPPRLIGPASRVPSTVRRARLRRLCTKPSSVTETFVARAAESDPVGYGLPEWVERDFRGYLECGIVAHGFARARCEACGHERLIPFSARAEASAPAPPQSFLGACPECGAGQLAYIRVREVPHLRVQRMLSLGEGAVNGVVVS